MKFLAGLIGLSLLLSSCKNIKSKIIEGAYVDSLINNYTQPRQVKDNEQEMQFWKNRINPAQPGQVNESRYASTLMQRFHEFGDINDVKQAEAVLNGINKTYNNTLASPFAALAGAAITTHHFSLADTLLQKAVKVGMETNSRYALAFDVYFELGRYYDAGFNLGKLKPGNDYNYYFRRSKMDHLNGTIDSAISAMNRAAYLVKASPYLQGIALSNAADLNIHAGNLQNAAALYKQCIRLNSIDFHSILGLGWIALVHDKNDTLAQRLFQFVLNKNKLPDPLFKLYQMAQQRGDKQLEKKYASEFAARATDTVYGKMYNKYLIEIYTDVLHQPAKAEALAKAELTNRATPQTYAWYAYALLMNNKKSEAYQVFEQHVSGKPLEGLELYYMGKLMKGLEKGYNAEEFFKAAEKNLYDLSPAMQKDLNDSLEE